MAAFLCHRSSCAEREQLQIPLHTYTISMFVVSMAWHRNGLPRPPTDFGVSKVRQQFVLCLPYKSFVLRCVSDSSPYLGEAKPSHPWAIPAGIEPSQAKPLSLWGKGGPPKINTSTKRGKNEKRSRA